MIADWPLLPWLDGLIEDWSVMPCRRLIKPARRRERDIPANGCRHERIGMIIASNPDPGARGRCAARCAAAGKDLDNDHAAAAGHGARSVVTSGSAASCSVDGSTSAIGAAINCLARAMLALQLASSP
jgi:hypothetical protein